MEFSVVYPDKIKLHFFPLRKRNSCLARGFIRRLGNFFSLRRRRKFHLFGCCSIHIWSGKSIISIHILDVSQKHAGSPNHAVKRKNKYRAQNVIRFHLQGCSCVLKRPPTQPTRKDAHCNDKRFGNLPPSFTSLPFFLGSTTVRSLALVKACLHEGRVPRLTGLPG